VRLVVLIVGMVLLIAACGGESGDETPDTDAADTPDTTAAGSADTTAAPQVEDAPAATTTTAPPAAEGEESTGGDVSTGSATVAGETYEFLDTGFPGLQCEPSSFGVAFIAGLQSAEENNGVIGSITVGIPFPGQEETAGILPAVIVSDGETEWIADPEHAELNGIPTGSSQVDSYEIDGNTISGTATFYEESSSFTGNEADLVVEQGSFEVTCTG
jgi:hypothetical protein